MSSKEKQRKKNERKGRKKLEFVIQSSPSYDTPQVVITTIKSQSLVVKWEINQCRTPPPPLSTDARPEQV